MAHLCLIGQIKEVTIHLLPRQGRDGERGHKLLPRAGQHRRDRRPALPQTPDQIQRLIGGNAPPDDQKNAFPRQHVTLTVAFDPQRIGKGDAICQWQSVDPLEPTPAPSRGSGLAPRPAWPERR